MKTYTARNAADALAMARGDLGQDAVVLHTRTYRRGGLLGIPQLGGRAVVEVTAIALPVLQAAARRRGRRQAAAGGAGEPEDAAAAGALGVSKRRLKSAPAPLAGDLIRRTYAAARLDLDEPGAAAAAAAALADPVRERPGGEPPGRERRSDRPAATPPPDRPAKRPAAANVEPPAALAGELAAVRELVERVARSQQVEAARRAAPELFKAAGAGGDGPIAQAYERLIHAEVAEELARRLVAAAADAGGAGGAGIGDGGVRDALERMLRGSREADAGSDRPAAGAGLEAYTGPASDRRPLTLALVGPTGVGKTTTIAKLAAQLKLRHGQKVGVVTLDTYRIGAVEQLRTYCNIIGSDLAVASSPEELADRLAGLAGCDVVLIDTAGRSPRDTDRVNELGAFLAVARPHQTHLVLSLASSPAVLRTAGERFASARPDRIIFTKCDEVEACGGLVAVVEATGLPPSFLTTGQEVPHDIEPADAAALARRLAGPPPPAPAATPGEPAVTGAPAG
ncbi:flagellar biosynthesis protein FlhF [Phycisphaera mikurensis]|uniref:Flagellar biosynthesis protein FlhF n=1 Tax=Phycisphaera mikurensis (strain NBRC 102666 / KCTC 22515 / FYK2301M01) TaxID=1142394 RepID=I0IGQ4_PHYMF|nr:putative flagellar biosynthesis protein FlhF [Phycisphaera mikurensis]MBB6443232.1 flagellar biosynthesis protein FlhF [Phycisphaera mikurensis]BAM04442.1 putative flagellar biosynthesis protein FlhF [Phycisphaera mikurensis NBRC 102666]